MTTPEDTTANGRTASTPQETPSSRPAKPSSDTPPQAQPEITTAQETVNAQPTPPPVPGAPRKTRILPERQTPEAAAPAVPTPGAAGLSDPAAALADLNWMPPPEDQVARFLNDVADITPPPVRERAGERVPGFLLPTATSPEEMKRKKAKAEPFWSQVVATPMEQRAPVSAAAGPRRGKRKRAGLRLRWLIVGGVILLLVIAALALLVLARHMLPGSVHL